MNILVIGNGFDLAHGLPTAYPDFLGFCRMIKAVYSEDKIGNADKIWVELGIKLKNNTNTERLKMKFSELYSIAVTEKNEQRESFVRTNTVYDELYLDIKNNIWLEYFLQNPMYQKENWIDFEGEISKVIQSLDGDMEFDEDRRYEIQDTVVDLSNSFLQQKYAEYMLTHRSMTALTEGRSERITFREIRDKMYEDLTKLIRALEIYLTDYVGKMECNIISPDIKDIAYNIIETQEGTKGILYSNVLCFNYTNTYERIYVEKSKLGNSIDYIHGKANADSTIVSNNMVLGIDEYLLDDRKNKDIEFIAFKKFYQ